MVTYYSYKRVWVDNETNLMLDRLSIRTIGFFSRDDLFEIIIHDWITKIIDLKDSHNNTRCIEEFARLRRLNVSKKIRLWVAIRDDLWEYFRDVCDKIYINMSVGFKDAVLGFSFVNENNFGNIDVTKIETYIKNSMYDGKVNNKYTDNICVYQENYDIDELKDILSESGCTIRVCGAYTIYNRHSRKMYHGSSRDIFNRIRLHICTKDLEDRLGIITDVSIYFVDNYIDALIIERYFILNTDCINRIIPKSIQKKNIRELISRL